MIIICKRATNANMTIEEVYLNQKTKDAKSLSQWCKSVLSTCGCLLHWLIRGVCLKLRRHNPHSKLKSNSKPYSLVTTYITSMSNQSKSPNYRLNNMRHLELWINTLSCKILVMEEDAYHIHVMIDHCPFLYLAWRKDRVCCVHAVFVWYSLI